MDMQSGNIDLTVIDANTSFTCVSELSVHLMAIRLAKIRTNTADSSVYFVSSSVLSSTHISRKSFHHTTGYLLLTHCLKDEESMVPRDAHEDEVMCLSPKARVWLLVVQMEHLTRTPTWDSPPHAQSPSFPVLRAGRRAVNTTPPSSLSPFLI